MKLFIFLSFFWVIVLSDVFSSGIQFPDVPKYIEDHLPTLRTLDEHFIQINK